MHTATLASIMRTNQMKGHDMEKIKKTLGFIGLFALNMLLLVVLTNCVGLAPTLTAAVAMLMTYRVMD